MKNLPNSTALDNDEWTYRLALNLVPGIGVKLTKALISHFASAEAIFSSSSEEFKQIPGVSDKIIKSIKSKSTISRAEKEIDFISKNNISAVYFTERNYPYRLKQCEDSPPFLFYKGNQNLNHKRILGIVGTRKATDYGKSFIKNLMKDLKEMDVAIVSGLAYGIDICAHKEAIHNGLVNYAV